MGFGIVAGGVVTVAKTVRDGPVTVTEAVTDGTVMNGCGEQRAHADITVMVSPTVGHPPPKNGKVPGGAGGHTQQRSPDGSRLLIGLSFTY